MKIKKGIIKKHDFEPDKFTPELQALLGVTKKEMTDPNLKCITAVSVDGTYLSGFGLHYTYKYKEAISIGESLSLEQIINELKPKNIFQITACLAFYTYCSFDDIKTLKSILDEKQKTVSKYPLITPLLKDSYGILIWAYQYEIILKLACVKYTTKEKQTIIKEGITNQKHCAVEMLRNILIFDTNIFNLFEQISCVHAVLNPNFFNAIIIYNYMNKTNIKNNVNLNSKRVIWHGNKMI